MTDHPDIVERLTDPALVKARELFGWAAGLGGFDVAAQELIDYVRAEVREPQAWTTYAHIHAIDFGKSGLFVKTPGTIFCVPVLFGRAQHFDDHRDPT